MGKSLRFEEGAVERGDQQDEEAKICRGRVCVNLEGEQERQCLCCQEIKESTT